MKNKKKVSINWAYVEYLICKGLSRLGYICCGMYICAMVEFGCDFWSVGGILLGLALGICANIGNKYEKSQED